MFSVIGNKVLNNKLELCVYVCVCVCVLVYLYVCACSHKKQAERVLNHLDQSQYFVLHRPEEKNQFTNQLNTCRLLQCYGYLMRRITTINH